MLHMRVPLATLLQSLLDSSRGLGAGLVDRHGFLLESCGAHDAHDSVAIGAFLSHHRLAPLEMSLTDTVSEQVWIGNRYSFYMHWLGDGTKLLYVMAPARAPGGPIRQALRQAGTALENSLEPPVSGTPLRERLEQPRQFVSDILIR
jgi:hypothetical protein